MNQAITVIAAIIESEGKIYIARRAIGKHLEGYWEFPGGKELRSNLLRPILSLLDISS